MPLPITNARLLRIKGGGFSPAYRDDPSPDAIKWEGNVGAMVEERVRKAVSGNNTDRAKETTIIIPGDLKPPVEIKVGDTVKYRYLKVEYEREIATYEGFFGVGPKIVELSFDTQ